MKKFISVVLCAALLGSTALAQELYIGVAGATPTEANDDTLGLSAQLGVGLLAGFSVRAAAETSADLDTFRLVSGDLLYNIGLPLTQSKVYLGAGADVFFDDQPDDAQDIVDGVDDGPFGVHVVGGGELRLGRFGVFGEVQPGVLLEDIEDFDTYLRARAGVNLHF